MAQRSPSSVSHLDQPLAIPLTDALGAELRGFDLAAGLDDAAFRFLQDALHRYSVVLLRDQTVTPGDLVALTARLGPLRGKSLLNRYALKGFPDVTLVSNIKEDGEYIGMSDAGVIWHTDLSYSKTPDMYSMLFGVQIPQRDGVTLGNTQFASSAAAYDALSGEMKARIANLKAVHSYRYHIEKKTREGSLTRKPLTEQEKSEVPDVEHPIARTHPITGRKCLFVTEGHTERIASLPAEEGDPLLNQLRDHIKQPEFVYSHTWRPGDLVIWDNCSTQHLAIKDYGTIPRLLYQLGVAGPAPF